MLHCGNVGINRPRQGPSTDVSTATRKRRFEPRWTIQYRTSPLSSRPMRTVPFMARCPKCGYDWLQDGGTRRTLLELLRDHPSIKAYCMCCAGLWTISTEEQRAIGEALVE
jgi:hypothetical protein